MMTPTCKSCTHFLGGGDWSLCCSNPPEDQVGWCGFLCYEDTPACENFKPNCNKCDEISITEEEQRKLPAFSNHMCYVYKQRCLHNSSRLGYHQTIYPCAECAKDGYKNYKEATE